MSAVAVAHLFAALRDEGDAAYRAESTVVRARDDAWVAQLRASDEGLARDAFDALFHAYAESLGRFARSYVDDADAAEEILTDVFLSIWERRRDWIPEHGAAVYLYGAVRNRAHNAWRAMGRRERLASAVARQDEVPGLGAHPASISDVMEDEEVHALVWRAIDALPEPRRQAVILRWHHGMSAPEIAKVLEITPGAVYQLLNRAHALLRELLGAVLA